MCPWKVLEFFCSEKGTNREFIIIIVVVVVVIIIIIIIIIIIVVVIIIIIIIIIVVVVIIIIIIVIIIIKVITKLVPPLPCPSPSSQPTLFTGNEKKLEILPSAKPKDLVLSQVSTYQGDRGGYMNSLPDYSQPSYASQYRSISLLASKGARHHLVAVAKATGMGMVTPHSPKPLKTNESNEQRRWESFFCRFYNGVSWQFRRCVMKT